MFAEMMALDTVLGDVVLLLVAAFLGAFWGTTVWIVWWLYKKYWR